ncbi:after-VIT domain-containing protein [Pseudanabaena sp. PCC 6802]|uniref:after-VIT domain-containing protein n=1 Tax=Pseudanabaena sp. PCC 6802 TaxID=118173 RepID=UPI00034492DB|nr:after-VIT domain-containing protein [Pseudanabaena sp. PCC 6802]
MSSPQALVQKHLYELPTCVLEVQSQRSPLSEWSDRPIAQNLQFRLTLESSQSWFSKKQRVIQGDRTQLGKLIVAVADYVDRFLSDDLVTNLTHKLSVPGLSRLNLSTLQLFDLVSNLEQFAIDVTILPTVELEVKRITPAWLKIAAIVIATVGISTSAVTLIFRSPTPELVTSSNRDREVAEKSADSQREPDAISSARPKESAPVSPSPKSAPDREQSLPHQTTKQTPASAPSTSRSPKRESPPDPIIALSPSPVEPSPTSSPPPLPDNPDKIDKVVSSQSPPASKIEGGQLESPSPSSSLPRTITPPIKPQTTENKDENLRRDRQTLGSGTIAAENSDRHNLPASPPTQPAYKPAPLPPAPMSQPTPDRSPSIVKRPETEGFTTKYGQRSQSLPVPAPVPVTTPAAVTAPPNRSATIQVGNIETNLSQDVKDSLTKHLQAIGLSANRSGAVVFDISIERGKVVQIQFDLDASTLKDKAVMSQIERSLLNWQPPISTNGKIRLSVDVRHRDR